MSKLAPKELWRRHTLERFEAFKQSGDLKELSEEGLAACGRKKKFTSMEWAKSPMGKRYSSSRYMDWYHKCETVAEKFGLAITTVICACLVSGFKPDEAGLVIESQWPQIRLITESTDAQFLARLSYESQLRGLYVIVKHGSVEIIQLYLNPVPTMNMEPPPMLSLLPPLGNSFKMRVETPVDYPPQAAAKLQKDANQIGKEILIALGYSIPKRLRISRMVSKADDLRISEKRLPKRGLYEIVANTSHYGSRSKDEKRRKTVKTQRHRLWKRLVKPYEQIKAMQEDALVEKDDR